MSTPMALDDRLEWKRDVRAAIERFAEGGRPFEANDLTLAGLREPPHPNMWGAAFGSAARAGLIQEVAYRPSARKSRSGGRNIRWVGVPDAQTVLFSAA
jgi:hypothetical protein